MALNLIRNSRVFFSTAVDATTGVNNTAKLNTDTFEIQVLDGLSFSQNTNSETVTLNEAGSDPVRGQRSFNTALAPVDFSFSTYMRPKKVSTTIEAEESVLWNALLGSTAIGTTGVITAVTAATTPTATYSSTTGILTISGTGIVDTNITAGDNVILAGFAGATAAELEYINAPGRVIVANDTTITVSLNKPSTAAIAGITMAIADIKFYKSAWAPVGSTYSTVGSHGSNTNNLQKFGLVVLIDKVAYTINNCTLNQATIDFGLDGIATIAWTGQATEMKQISTDLTATNGAFAGANITGTYKSKVTDAKYLTNKLSTVTLKAVNALKDSAGTAKVPAGQEYAVALTGGNITINNNITYITPSNLGTVNLPIAYFTGTRAISGSLNAYLKTGTLSGSLTAGTGKLLQDMLDVASVEIAPMFALVVTIGGGSTATTRIEVDMPTAVLTIPTVNTEQVVSTVINFTAQSASGASATRDFDLEQTNEIALRYYTT